MPALSSIASLPCSALRLPLPARTACDPSRPQLSRQSQTLALICALGFLLLALDPAYAQPSSEANADPFPDPPPLAQLSAAYTAETVANVSGGQERGIRYLDNVDIQLLLHLYDLTGVDGLTVFAYGLGNQGGSPSELVGDLQATSNIEAPMAWRLYELWVEKAWTNGARRAGLYDLNSEFDVNNAGSLFLQSSHGIGAAYGLSGVNGPSIFPATSLGARLRARLTDESYLQAAVLDAVPDRPANREGPRVALGDGALLAGEFGLYRSLFGVSGERSSKVAVGGWLYTREFTDLSTLNRPVPAAQGRGHGGTYMLIEGMVWRKPGTKPPLGSDRSEEGLHAFLRLGIANDTYTRIARYIGAGVTYQGLTTSEQRDELGLSVAAAFNGSAYENAQARAGTDVANAEVAVEGTYAISPADWLTVTGDLQVVLNPNTRPNLDPAIVPALRVTVSK